jgi:hypothetical protein
VRLRWKTAAGAVVVAVAAALGGVAPGGNLLATVSYPDGNPSVNVAQFARDVISSFVNVG